MVLRLVIFLISFIIVKLFVLFLQTILVVLNFVFPNFHQNGIIKEVLIHFPIRIENYFSARELTHVSELAKQCNVGLESHYAVTEDGFILCLHRIVSKKKEGYIKDVDDTFDSKLPSEFSNIDKSIPVLLMHGILQDSESFVCCGEDSLAVILANHGFDVWLGNNRGNRYSHGHVRLSLDDDAYWNYCVDDMARHDVPTIVSYVLSTTEHKNIQVIGFSQGSAQFLCALSLYPTLNKSISLFITLAPAARADISSNILLASLVEANPFFVNIFFGNKAILPFIQGLRRLMLPPSYCWLVKKQLQFAFNWQFRCISPHRQEALFQHIFSYCSVKAVVQWFQIINEKRLCMYKHPPSLLKAFTPRKSLPYDLSIISCPVVIIAGAEDSLVNPDTLRRQIKKCVHVHTEPHYEHLDLIWADTARQNIFPVIIDLLEKYK